jgi:hypothetical protein
MGIKISNEAGVQLFKNACYIKNSCKDNSLMDVLEKLKKTGCDYLDADFNNRVCEVLDELITKPGNAKVNKACFNLTPVLRKQEYKQVLNYLKSQRVESAHQCN